MPAPDTTQHVTFGLQPVMVIGSAVTTVCLVWFGLSGSYRGACAARVVAGLCNSIICAWKCIIADRCTPALQVRAGLKTA